MTLGNWQLKLHVIFAMQGYLLLGYVLLNMLLCAFGEILVTKAGQPCYGPRWSDFFRLRSWASSPGPTWQPLQKEDDMEPCCLVLFLPNRKERQVRCESKNKGFWSRDFNVKEKGMGCHHAVLWAAKFHGLALPQIGSCPFTWVLTWNSSLMPLRLKKFLFSQANVRPGMRSAQTRLIKVHSHSKKNEICFTALQFRLESLNCFVF